VGDYAEALRQALSRKAEVRVNTDGDVNLYHLGNNELHAAIYHRALARPGVVILHDAVLHHFYLGQLSRDEYVEEFVYNYGEWYRGLAERLYDGRSRSGIAPEYFRYPMLARVAQTSRIVMVHNKAAEQAVKLHAADTPVVTVPHILFRPPDISADDVEETRRTWGAEKKSMVFGIFGHLRETKRVASCVRAFLRLRQAQPQVRLVVSGRPTSEAYRKTLEPLLAQPGILRLGQLEERDFWRVAMSVDACINLRYPQAGETSGIAIRLMAAGKPVLLSDGLEVSELPPESCVRIDTGLCEEDMLYEHMLWLTLFPDDARAIGTAAAKHIRLHHEPALVADRMMGAITGLGEAGVR
jgi:glycosyltransferase involved in cell wall biosynthesis